MVICFAWLKIHFIYHCFLGLPWALLSSFYFSCQTQTLLSSLSQSTLVLRVPVNVFKLLYSCSEPPRRCFQSWPQPYLMGHALQSNIAEPHMFSSSHPPSLFLSFSFFFFFTPYRYSFVERLFHCPWVHCHIFAFGRPNSHVTKPAHLVILLSLMFLSHLNLLFIYLFFDCHTHSVFFKIFLVLFLQYPCSLFPHVDKIGLRDNTHSCHISRFLLILSLSFPHLFFICCFPFSCTNFQAT